MGASFANFSVRFAADPNARGVIARNPSRRGRYPFSGSELADAKNLAKKSATSEGAFTAGSLQQKIDQQKSGFLSGTRNAFNRFFRSLSSAVHLGAILPQSWREPKRTNTQKALINHATEFLNTQRYQDFNPNTQEKQESREMVFQLFTHKSSRVGSIIGEGALVDNEYYYKNTRKGQTDLKVIVQAQSKVDGNDKEALKETAQSLLNFLSPVLNNSLENLSADSKLELASYMLHPNNGNTFEILDILKINKDTFSANSPGKMGSSQVAWLFALSITNNYVKEAVAIMKHLGYSYDQTYSQLRTYYWSLSKLGEKPRSFTAYSSDMGAYHDQDDFKSKIFDGIPLNSKVRYLARHKPEDFEIELLKQQISSALNDLDITPEQILQIVNNPNMDSGMLPDEFNHSKVLKYAQGLITAARHNSAEETYLDAHDNGAAKTKSVMTYPQDLERQKKQTEIAAVIVYRDKFAAQIEGHQQAFDYLIKTTLKPEKSDKDLAEEYTAEFLDLQNYARQINIKIPPDPYLCKRLLGCIDTLSENQVIWNSHGDSSQLLNLKEIISNIPEIANAVNKAHVRLQT